MQLFSRIPDRFFSILSSAKKELYVQALFVLREAFRTELVIRREDLTSMLIDSMEDAISEADFSEEAIEDGDSAGQEGNLSGKAHLLIRRLKETGWIDTEYEVHSFDENITVPDYSVSVINLLFDLSNEAVSKRQISFVHWSDIDLGGFRLYQRLKKEIFPYVRPWKMDLETLKENKERGMPITSEAYQKALADLLKDESYSVFADTIQYMLTHKIRLEQEVLI